MRLKKEPTQMHLILKSYKRICKREIKLTEECKRKKEIHTSDAKERKSIRGIKKNKLF